MKLTAFLGLPLLASAAVLDSRQTAPKAGFIKIETAKEAPRIRSDAKRTLAWYGREYPFLILFYCYALTLTPAYELKGSTAGAGGAPKGGGMGMGDSTLGGRTLFNIDP